MREKPEMRGRKALSSSRKMTCVTLHLLPREVEEIRAYAEEAEMTVMEWKRRAIRAALERERKDHEWGRQHPYLAQKFGLPG